MMDQRLFTNCVRSLFNIGGYLLPELTAEQQGQFIRDPVRYFIGTDKAQQDAIFREVAKRQPAEQPSRQAPIVQNWSGHGKYTLAFGFEPGALNIKLAGHDASDGNGEFVFADECLEWDEDQETGKQYRWVAVPNSELLAIRDKLNEIFPPATPRAERQWYPHLDYAGEPMEPGQFRDPPQVSA